MLDLNKITSGDLERKVGGLPQTTQDFLSSDAFSAKIAELQDNYALLEDLDQPATVEQLVVLLVAGFIKPNELIDDLEQYAYIDHERAEGLAKDTLEVVKQVLPVETLAPTFAPAFTGAKSPTSTPPSALNKSHEPAKSEAPLRHPPLLKPDLAKSDEKESASAEPKPFVLHERGESPSGGKQNVAFGISRPTFIKPQIPLAGSQPSSPAVAKIDFGSPKVVNYGSPQQEVPIKTTAKKSDPVKPENVVDLKDLPQ